MNSQTLIQLQESSAFQQAIESIESLPLETPDFARSVKRLRRRSKKFKN